MSNQPIELRAKKSQDILAGLDAVQTQGMGGMSNVFYTIVNTYRNQVVELLVENERLYEKYEKNSLSTDKNRAQRRREAKQIKKTSKQ